MPVKKKGYKEILALVEEFMEATDIRMYCTDVCGGKCCCACYKSKKACHKTDGRRLACSAYICIDSKRVVLNKTQSDIHDRLADSISSEMFNAQQATHEIGSPYFKPVSKETQAAFEMNPAPILQLLKHTKAIQHRLEVVHTMIQHTCSLKKRRR